MPTHFVKTLRRQLLAAILNDLDLSWDCKWILWIFAIGWRSTPTFQHVNTSTYPGTKCQNANPGFVESKGWEWFLYPITAKARCHTLTLKSWRPNPDLPTGTFAFVCS